MNDGSPPDFPHRPIGWRGPWVFRKDAGRRTRAFVLAAGFLKLVDRLTELTRLTSAMRALSATQKGIFTSTVTMTFFLQDLSISTLKFQ